MDDDVAIRRPPSPALPAAGSSYHTSVAPASAGLVPVGATTCRLPFLHEKQTVEVFTLHQSAACRDRNIPPVVSVSANRGYQDTFYLDRHDLSAVSR